MVPIPSRERFVVTAIQALRDYDAGAAAHVDSIADANGIGRLHVQYSSADAARKAIERAFEDAAEGHADTWTQHLDQRGGTLTVTYAFGVRVDEQALPGVPERVDRQASTPVQRPRRGRK